MPRYDYRCLACEQVFTIRHGIKDVVDDCKECGEQGHMQKIPSIPRVVKRTKTGEIVKRHIEEAKQEIKDFKKDMSKEMS